jgi:hypothetical protein
MTLKRSFLAVILTVISLGHTGAQEQDANGKVISPIVFANVAAITCTLVDVPAIGRSDTGGDAAQWLKVEFRYAVAPKDPLPFLDSVEFRIWLEGRDLYDPTATTAEGIPVALTGKVTYVNLPANKDTYGSFYVHPSVLARYSTKNGGSSDFTDHFNVHIEAYVNGAKVDYFDKNKEADPNWFSSLKVITGMVYRQDQCAFIVNDPSHYPQIKVPAQ